MNSPYMRKEDFFTLTLKSMSTAEYSSDFKQSLFYFVTYSLL